MRVYVIATIVMLAMMLGSSTARAADGPEGNDASGQNEQNDQACAPAGESCDPCLDSCRSRPRCWGLVAGVEASYLKPNIRGEGTLLEEGPIRLGSGHLASFSDLTGSPRIWLGIETDSGWGFRGRYWEYTAAKSKDSFTVFEDPTILATLSTNSRLHVYAVDAEATRRFGRGDWGWLASFGLRNTGLKVNHGFDLFEAASIDDDFTIAGSATTNSVRQVDATGLTSSLETRRPFGNRGLAFAWNVRGSVVWGNDMASASSRLMVPDVTATQLAVAQEGTTQYIFETQVGVEWSRRIQCLKGSAFAHLMFEYQRWTADLRRAAFTMSQTVNGTTLSLNSIEPNVDFTGLALAIGFTR